MVWLGPVGGEGAAVAAGVMRQEGGGVDMGMREGAVALGAREKEERFV
jgi:hypothetical protein